MGNGVVQMVIIKNMGIKPEILKQGSVDNMYLLVFDKLLVSKQ